MSDTTTPKFQPRYIAYAAANGRTAEQQRVHDGGRLAGFILWIGAQWREWRAETGRVGTQDGDLFDAWLARRCCKEARR